MGWVVREVFDGWMRRGVVRNRVHVGRRRVGGGEGLTALTAPKKELRRAEVDGGYTEAHIDRESILS